MCWYVLLPYWRTSCRFGSFQGYGRFILESGSQPHELVDFWHRLCSPPRSTTLFHLVSEGELYDSHTRLPRFCIRQVILPQEKRRD